MIMVINADCRMTKQWRSEGIWRPGDKLNFATPPLKKILKNDIEMSIVFRTLKKTDHVYNHIA